MIFFELVKVTMFGAWLNHSIPKVTSYEDIVREYQTYYQPESDQDGLSDVDHFTTLPSGYIIKVRDEKAYIININLGLKTNQCSFEVAPMIEDPTANDIILPLKAQRSRLQHILTIGNMIQDKLSTNLPTPDQLSAVLEAIADEPTQNKYESLCPIMSYANGDNTINVSQAAVIIKQPAEFIELKIKI